MHEVGDLHLPVEVGDSIGFLLPSGQVDLGLRTRPQPDGAVQWFMEPCGPCHMDGGTGRELLVEARVEPDEDEDLLGDESQDSDYGLDDEQSEELEEDEYDDWFDELESDEEKEPASTRVRDFDSATSIVRGTATCSYGSTRPDTDGSAESSPPLPAVGTSAFRGRSAWAKVVRRAQPSPYSAAPVTGRATDRAATRSPARARIVVYHLSRSGIKVTMRQIRL